MLAGMTDAEAIRTLLRRLGRPHPSGGTAVERAAIMAEGAGSEQVLAWIAEHGGEPEAVASKAKRHGLHGDRLHEGDAGVPRTPARFVLPPGALD